MLFPHPELAGRGRGFSRHRSPARVPRLSMVLNGLLCLDRAWRRLFGKHHAPAMSQSGMTIRRTPSRLGVIPLNSKVEARMNRTFIITAMLLLSPFPALGQSDPGGEGHDSSYSRRD